MKKILLVFLLALILNFVGKASATEPKEGTWTQILKSTPKGVANPLITQAIGIALKTKPHNLIVLDLGAGTGRNINDLLAKGATIYAYDADPESIKLMSEQFNCFLNNKKLYMYQESF